MQDRQWVNAPSAISLAVIEMDCQEKKPSVKANGEKNNAFLQLGSLLAVIPASYISTIKCK